MKVLNAKLREKFIEALKAVLPIVAIVLILGFTIAPVTPSVLLCFLVGTVMVMAGMMFFTLGAEMSMTPMGEKVGACMTKSKKIVFIVIMSFVLGVIITISEPDLQVLASQVPSVPNMTLILSVAAGVGVFLAIALIRMLIGIALPPLLAFFYIIVFILMAFVPESFRAVAFDSGGVTTGPMTVPFIMALGIGIASIRNDKHAADDSFGLVALCSIGPVLAVMTLGMIYRPAESSYSAAVVPEVADSVELWHSFWEWYAILYKRDSNINSPYYNSIWNFSAGFIETYRQKSLENRDRTFVYIYRTCTFSHRSKRRIYASG